jgi:hypothetical protein
MSSFELDLQAMHGSGSGLQSAADQLNASIGGFQGQLGAFGEPWGNDDIGSLIGVAYTEIAQYIFDCLGTSADEIASAGADVVTMAQEFGESDGRTADALRSIMGG